jgi:hypothetical protein
VVRQWPQGVSPAAVLFTKLQKQKGVQALMRAAVSRPTSAPPFPSNTTKNSQSPQSPNFTPSYRKHKRTHTKPVKCPYCPHGVAQRKDLLRHFDAHHTDEPEVQKNMILCQEPGCDYKSSRKDNVRRHRKMVHRVAV